MFCALPESLTHSRKREQGRCQIELLYSFFDWDDTKIEVKKFACAACFMQCIHEIQSNCSGIKTECVRMDFGNYFKSSLV